MSQDPLSQDNNNLYDTNTLSNHKNSGMKKILLISIGVLVCIAGVAAVIYSTQPDENTKKALEAARKVTPNAEITSVKTAGGFAIGIVSDPTTTSQAVAGNTTVFTVNKDGTMTQLAASSSFDPIDLLGLGISLDTQAKLAGTNKDQVRRNLSDTCGYNRGTVPGYSGLDSSFNPNGWKISPLSLDSLKEALTGEIIKQNTSLESSKKTICVNAVRSGSSNVNGIFTIEVQFITNDGMITKHKVSYSIESGFRRSFTLDDKAL